MNPSVSHDRSEDTPEGKARWFQSLTMEQRLAIFMDAFKLTLEINPNIIKANDAGPVRKGVQILVRE